MRDNQLYLISYNNRQMEYVCKGDGDPWVSLGSCFALALPLQKHLFYCQHPQLKRDDIVYKQCRGNTYKCCFTVVNRRGNVFVKHETKHTLSKYTDLSNCEELTVHWRAGLLSRGTSTD